MDIAVAGIKYCGETARLIESNFKDFHTDVYNIDGGSCIPLFRRGTISDKCVYIITDRSFDDIKIKPDLYIEAVRKLISVIRKEDTAIINVDDTDLIRHLEGLDCNIITYGYNSKSSVTISGLEEDFVNGKTEYVCSLQRSIITAGGDILDPCEIKVSVPSGISAHSIMGYCAFSLYAGKISVIS